MGFATSTNILWARRVEGREGKGECGGGGEGEMEDHIRVIVLSIRWRVGRQPSGILYSFSPCSCFDPLFLSALFVCFFLVSIFGSFWCILGSSGSRICVAAFVLHPCPTKGSSTVPPFCSTCTQWIWGEVWGIIVNNFAHQRSFGNQDSSQRKLCLVIVSVHTTKKTTKNCTCSFL